MKASLILKAWKASVVAAHCPNGLVNFSGCMPMVARNQTPTPTYSFTLQMEGKKVRSCAYIGNDTMDSRRLVGIGWKLTAPFLMVPYLGGLEDLSWRTTVSLLLRNPTNFQFTKQSYSMLMASRNFI